MRNAPRLARLAIPVMAFRLSSAKGRHMVLIEHDISAFILRRRMRGLPRAAVRILTYSRDIEGRRQRKDAGARGEHAPR